MEMIYYWKKRPLFYPIGRCACRLGTYDRHNAISRYHWLWSKRRKFHSTIFKMNPTPPTVPSKKTIQDSFHGATTRRAYNTYQKQFEAFLKTHKSGIDPSTTGTEDCTDFFHHLYSQGKKARTIDLAKSALVTFFNARGVVPSPGHHRAPIYRRTTKVQQTQQRRRGKQGTSTHGARVISAC